MQEDSKIAAAVIATIEDITGIPAEKIGMADRLSKMMTGDDFSFVFVPNVEKCLGFCVDPSSWRTVSTVAQAIELFRSAGQ